LKNGEMKNKKKVVVMVDGLKRKNGSEKKKKKDASTVKKSVKNVGSSKKLKKKMYGLKDQNGKEVGGLLKDYSDLIKIEPPPLVMDVTALNGMIDVYRGQHPFTNSPCFVLTQSFPNCVDQTVFMNYSTIPELFSSIFNILTQ
jgi:hypothetical protein